MALTPGTLNGRAQMFNGPVLNGFGSYQSVEQGGCSFAGAGAITNGVIARITTGSIWMAGNGSIAGLSLPQASAGFSGAGALSVAPSLFLNASQIQFWGAGGFTSLYEEHHRISAGGALFVDAEVLLRFQMHPGYATSIVDHDGEGTFSSHASGSGLSVHSTGGSLLTHSNGQTIAEHA